MVDPTGLSFLSRCKNLSHSRLDRPKTSGKGGCGSALYLLLRKPYHPGGRVGLTTISPHTPKLQEAIPVQGCPFETAGVEI